MEPLVAAEPAVGLCSQEGTGDLNTVSTSAISGSVYGDRELKEERRLLSYKQAPKTCGMRSLLEQHMYLFKAV